MKVFKTLMSSARTLRGASVRSTQVFLGDVGHGLLEVCHNTFAMVGLVLFAITLGINYLAQKFVARYRMSIG